MIRKRGFIDRKVLTAAAIFQMLTAVSGQALANPSPAAEARTENRKKSALEILESMDEGGTILKTEHQAWMPGGYLGPSKSWG